ncbi:MAG: 3-phosphoshikimate 1-carboxyvinyltransferase [Sphingobacteriia bacterium]|nr:3-phosphoshikimate 1-carboxyvinyltransferase [Sphingobacteriia bacterium]
MEKNIGLNYSNAFVTPFKGSLNGEIRMCGDKSLSHRSLIIASNAIGTSAITGLLQSFDIQTTIQVLKTLGVKIEHDKEITYVTGVGIGGLKEPKDVLNFNNSGTTARLILGMLASYPYKIFATGDSSLRNRAMNKLAEVLNLFGATFEMNNYLLPLLMKGAQSSFPVNYHFPTGSAQLKSALIFGAINTSGISEVVEINKSRAHTETLLKYFEYPFEVLEENKFYQVRIKGHETIKARELDIIGDPSSALFITLGTLIIPNSKVIIRNILGSKERFKVYEILKLMGANIKIITQKDHGYEVSYDIEVESSELKAIEIEEDLFPSLVDEYIILSCACACAKGVSILKGLEGLKNKESNRLQAIFENLLKIGVEVAIKNNNLIIHGNKTIKGNCKIESYSDHRISMAFIILSLIAQENVVVKNIENIATSYPLFFKHLKKIGVNICLL